MLRRLVPKLRCAVCAGELQAHVFRGDDTRIVDGVLACARCAGVYAIEDRLLELVPPTLVDEQRRTRFAAVFASELTAARLSLPATVAGDVGAQLTQRDHFDWYADSEHQTYMEYQSSPFWTAEDARTFGRWRAQIAPGSWLLDVGCANGRSARPLLAADVTIVGCDISPRLVRQAIARADAEGVSDRACFLVADADRLPFADSTFDYVLTYGVLHHLPDPARACREIQRILVANGVHFGSENNVTILRRVFDAMMRWLPLWTEHAGAQPLISESMLRRWLDGLPVRFHCTTQVFVPPHVVNLVGHRGARPLLDASDRIARFVPGLGAQGGLIVFDARKLAA